MPRPSEALAKEGNRQGATMLNLYLSKIEASHGINSRNFRQNRFILH